MLISFGSYSDRTAVVQRSYSDRTAIVQRSYSDRTAIVQRSYSDRTAIVQRSYMQHCTLWQPPRSSTSFATSPLASSGGGCSSFALRQRGSTELPKGLRVSPSELGARPFSAESHGSTSSRPCWRKTGGTLDLRRILLRTRLVKDPM